MRIPLTLLAATLACSAGARADVKELDGNELLDSYVQGISIGPEVTDKAFASDDEQMRETNEGQRNALSDTAPEFVVKNAESLNRDPGVDQFVSKIQDQQTRDLVEDAITQTSLSTRLDVNLDRVAAERGMPPPASTQDFSVLRGTVLELLPSATGYQFEFMKDRF